MKHLVTTVCLGLILSSSAFAQTDKTVIAFNKSIEQEKALNYNAAIETITNLNDSTSYENNIRLGWLCYKAGYKKNHYTITQKQLV